MIWVRRIIALPFIILAFITFQVGVLAQQTASNLISASFYLETLADSNAYSFLLTDLPTTALKDVRKANSNPIIEQSGLSDETIVNSINTIVPPDWLQCWIKIFIQFKSLTVKIFSGGSGMNLMEKNGIGLVLNMVRILKAQKFLMLAHIILKSTIRIIKETMFWRWVI